MSQRLLAEPLSEARVGALQRLPVVQGIRNRRIKSIDLAYGAHTQNHPEGRKEANKQIIKNTTGKKNESRQERQGTSRAGEE